MEIERSKKNWFLKKKSKNILSERREGLEAETGIIPGMAYSREEFVKKCCKDLLATAESLFGQWHFPTPLQMPHFRGISIKRATYFKNCSICNNQAEMHIPCFAMDYHGWFRVLVYATY